MPFNCENIASLYRLVSHLSVSATSEPKGPVYISARREVLEEELDPTASTNAITAGKWPAIDSAALSNDGMRHKVSGLPQPLTISWIAVSTIIDALLSAKFPLVLAGHSGRNVRTVPLLSQLSKKLAIALFTVCSSTVSAPYDHPHYLGMSYGGKNPMLHEADVIICLDAEVPWIDTFDNAPAKGAKVFVIDPDPLKQSYGWSHVDADLICRADVEVALLQLLQAANSASSRIDSSLVQERSQQLSTRHDTVIAGLVATETTLRDPTVAESPWVLATLREAVKATTPSHGVNTLWLNEGISNYPTVFDHIRPSNPGMMLCSGGSSLGWALGAAVGAGLASQGRHDLIVAVIGDGTFLFGVPSSAYWMAKRYNTVSLSSSR